MNKTIYLLLAGLTLVIGLFVGCRGTVELSRTGQDEALAFYRELYPITKELRQITDEWNRWNMQSSQLEYQQNLYSKSHSYETRLRALSNKVVSLYAPAGLRDLKDLTVSAINKGIESFSYAQEYARNPRNESYRLNSESMQLESNRLIGLAADAWDDGIARYKIKPSEIVR